MSLNKGKAKIDQSKFTYVVEHLDPELEAWQHLEYNTIAIECEQSGSEFILSGRPSELAAEPALRDVVTTSDSTEQLLQDAGIPKTRACLLDPKGEKDLSPADGDLFSVFVFGGILGDDPPRDRTAELRAKGFVGRRLGPEQMTTDTAARVTRMVVQDKSEQVSVHERMSADSSSVALAEVPYVDRPDIEVAKGETVSMPFKYVKGRDGLPVLPEVSHTP